LIEITGAFIEQSLFAFHKVLLRQFLHELKWANLFLWCSVTFHNGVVYQNSTSGLLFTVLSKTGGNGMV